MGRCDVELIDLIRRAVRNLCFQPGVGAHPLQEARHGVDVVARAPQIAHPQHVGFQLLVARVAAQIEAGNRAGKLC